MLLRTEGSGRGTTYESTGLGPAVLRGRTHGQCLDAGHGRCRSQTLFEETERDGILSKRATEWLSGFGFPSGEFVAKEPKDSYRGCVKTQ